MAKKKRNRNEERKDTRSTSNKKVVVTTSKKENTKKLQPTVSKTSSKKRTSKANASTKMLYGKQNFILMGAGALLVMLGLLLMAGGAQDPNEWNADEIYSFRRTVLSPILILAGLGLELWAIFKKDTTTN